LRVDSGNKQAYNESSKFNLLISSTQSGKTMRKKNWKAEAQNAEAVMNDLRRADKVRLLYGHGNWETNSISHKGIRSVRMSDGPLGLRIPTSEFDSERATCFPSPALVACTWNPDLAKQMGEAMAKEAIQAGVDVILAPGVNIKRNPLCGRNFEYLSEDPLLAGKIGSAIIGGIQSKGVGACLKHYACNNQETSRFLNDSQVDERALREIYLKPFEICVKESDPWMVMCSYNKINGVPAANHGHLLKDILKGEWKYNGVVVSDWGAVTDPIRNHNNGLDLEMPCFEHRHGLLTKAIRKGILEEEAVDDSAQRIICLSQKAAQRPEHIRFRYEDQREIALSVAEEGIVLAKNDDNVLPLRSYENCCVIGALAEETPIQGSGSSHVHPMIESSLLDEIRHHASLTSDTVAYAPGYPLHADAPRDEAKKLAIDACDLAGNHKYVIFVVGPYAGTESEGYDRDSMELPAAQIQLFKAVQEVNANIILVVIAGAPVELPMAENAPAILVSYFGGEAGSKAIHRILIGRANPSGKFAESWPIQYSDVPSSLFYPGDRGPSKYKESIYVGYRYYLSANIPVLFPFGHGLSYSRFTYKSLVLNRDELNEGQTLEVSFAVNNPSRYGGLETMQLYIAARRQNVFKPVRELKAFKKILIESGNMRQIKFTLKYEDFAHYDTETKQFAVEGGKYEILVGSSSEDIRLRRVVTVNSSKVFADKSRSFPSYYEFNDKSLYIPSDEEFERLLGHHIKRVIYSKKGSFNLNSTFGSTQNTLVGKRIIKALDKTIDPRCDKAAHAKEFDSRLRMPLRAAGMGGMSDKKILATIALLNGHLFHALWALCFGRRK